MGIAREYWITNKLVREITLGFGVISIDILLGTRIQFITNEVFFLGNLQSTPLAKRRAHLMEHYIKFHENIRDARA